MLALNVIFEGGDHLDVDMLDEDDRLRIISPTARRGRRRDHCVSAMGHFRCTKLVTVRIGHSAWARLTAC